MTDDVAQFRTLATKTSNQGNGYASSVTTVYYGYCC